MTWFDSGSPRRQFPPFTNRRKQKPLARTDLVSALPDEGCPPPARLGKSRIPLIRNPDRKQSETPAFGLRAAAGKTGERPSTPSNRPTTHQGAQPVREKSVSRSTRPLPAPGPSTAEDRMKMTRTPSLGFPETKTSLEPWGNSLFRLTGNPLRSPAPSQEFVATTLSRTDVMMKISAKYFN